jgi:ectoine hydroxylase-related dioxygenase (phytanoyl-CoA dioxygenase family)
MKKFIYNTNDYDFNVIISKILNCNNLSKIHGEKDFNSLIKESINNTHKFQQSEYHQKYYNNFDLIKPLYEKFLKEIIKPLYLGENIVYQKIPTFRIHFPNGMSVGMFHKDKDLRDYRWHELIKEDNYYLPFTDSYGSNTIWYETEEDKKDYTPMECKYGEIVKWDGTNLSHGNKINETEHTRVSIDFRVTSESLFKNNNNKSKNEKTSFVIGGYYQII